MKRFQLVLIVFLAISTQTEAQHYRLYGLEIYNPHLINPAFTGSDKLVQADFLRTDFYTYQRNEASIMTTLPNKHSSVGILLEDGSYYSGISYLTGKLGPKGLKHFKMGGSYSHTFSITEDLQLHAGGGLYYAKLRFLPGMQGIDSTLQYDNSYTTRLGAGMNFRNWELGLSANIPLGSYRYSLSEDNSLEREKKSISMKDFYFFGRYESQSERRVTFDPVFGLDCRLADGKSEWYGYAGGIVQIVDVVGLGFTAGSLLSVSANVNILDRVQLMLGIYGGEKTFQDQYRVADYKLNPGNRSYLIQLRVNL